MALAQQLRGLNQFVYGTINVWDPDQGNIRNIQVISFEPPRAPPNFFAFGNYLGGGSFGRTFQMIQTFPPAPGSKLTTLGDPINSVVKWIKIPLSKVKDFVNECKIQKKLYEKEPGVCPAIFNYGFIIVEGDPNPQKPQEIRKEFRCVAGMEKCEKDVRSLFLSLRNTVTKVVYDDVILDFLTQVAKLLIRLKKYEFNHRDMKSDNIMYMLDGDYTKYPFGRRYVLVDFGFSCATFDGEKLAGVLYSGFEGTECFRESRDLAQLIFELFLLKILSPDMIRFLKLVLTFEYTDKQGAKKTCSMVDKCLPEFNGEWKSVYDFLNRKEIENPNTTPQGFLKAVEVYTKNGIVACEGAGVGFVKALGGDACVRDPGVDVGALAAAGAGPVAPSPVEHLLAVGVSPDSPPPPPDPAAPHPVPKTPDDLPPGGGTRRRRKLRHTQKRKGK